jgi:hypothetical protein
VGKSLGALVLNIDMALAGEKIVIFDRENGANLYAERLDQIHDARGFDEEAMRTIAEGIAYYEFPRFRTEDEEELTQLCAGASLVVFDSQRMFLSDLGLEGSSNDDYAVFMATLVDPLFRSGTATLILDNAGHEEPKRGRGASAKGDLNEILFAFYEAEPFDLGTAGRLRLEIMDSRFGDSGTWSLILGGGLFETWDRVEEDAKPAEWQPTHYMEKVSRFIEENPDLPKTVITDESGLGKAIYVRQALETLVRFKYVKRADGPRGALVHTSLVPYRETDGAPVSQDGTGVGTGRDGQTLRKPSSSARPPSRPLDGTGDGTTSNGDPEIGTELGTGSKITCPRHGPKLVVKASAGYVFLACGCRLVEEPGL